MKKLLIVELILVGTLIAAASAETETVENYSVGSNLSGPHEIVRHSPDIITIKTFDGQVTIIAIAYPAYRANYTNNLGLGILTVNNQTGNIWAEKIGLDVYYQLIFPSLYVQSNLPFMDTADFFRSLKIEKIKKT